MDLSYYPPREGSKNTKFAGLNVCLYRFSSACPMAAQGSGAGKPEDDSSEWPATRRGVGLHVSTFTIDQSVGCLIALSSPQNADGFTSGGDTSDAGRFGERES